MVVLSGFGPWPSGVFFTGAASVPSGVVPAQYPVALAGHPYNVEWKLYQRSYIPVQREARTDDTEPGESTLSPAALWRRSQSDWALGAGQVWLDEEESTRRRFLESHGVDVFNDRKVTLLPMTEEKRTSANTNLRLLAVDERLYVVDGINVLFSDGAGSEQNATWVTGWSTATGLPGGSVLDIAYSGSHVYVLGSDNSIYRATPGTVAFTLFYNPTAVMTRMWFGLGRLFASDGRSLYEITATPGETLIFTHPSPNYVMSHVCGAPTGIYISGNVGSGFGEMRHSWVNDTGTAFVAPVVVAELDNERINVTVSAGPNLVLGTSIGFRYAPIDSLTTGLQFGPAVEIGDVRALAAESAVTPDGKLDTFCWFTWQNIHSTGDSGLGRMRLTRFTEPAVPAYAADIYEEVGGLPLCVATVGNRRYFGVSTEGFYGPTPNQDLVPTGTLNTGRIRYGVLDKKMFSDLEWRTSPLEGAVTGNVTFDTGGTTLAGHQDIQGTTGNNHGPIGPVLAEWSEIIFTLTRDPDVATLGPELRWWVMRAIPAPETTVRFVLPVRLHDAEQTPLGPIKDVDFMGELEFLQGLVNSKQIVKYQEGLRSYDVFVNNIEMNPTRWDRLEHGPQGITLVELHTVVHP